MVQSLTQAAVETDFDQIWAHYSTDFATRLEEPDRAKTLLRTIHRFGIVASILCKSIPAQRSEHKRVFLKEFSSDAIHLMHTIMVGDIRAGHFYLRSAVENLWRHIYFKDHPVEYRWLESDPKYYISVEELRQYCARTDEMHDRMGQPLQRIANGYRKLSRFVHSSQSHSLQLHGRLTTIQLSIGKLSEVVKDLRSFGRDLVLVSLVVHATEIARLPPGEERFAINFLDRPRKQLRLAALS